MDQISRGGSSRTDDHQSTIEGQAANYVKEWWDNHIRNTGIYRKKLNDWYRQYRGIPSRKNYDGLANVFVNETLEAVESIVAQIYSTIYMEPKRFRAEPTEETDESKAKLAEDLVVSSLRKMGDKVKILRTIRQLVKYGTAFVKIYRRYEKTRTTFRELIQDPMTAVQGSRIINADRVVYDDSDLEYLDLLDVAPDPGKSSIEDMDGIVLHYRTTFDELKARARNGGIVNLDKISKPQVRSLNSTNSDKFNRLSAIGINYQQIENGDVDRYEYWGKVPLWWVDESVDLNSDDSAQRVQGVIEVIDNGGGVVCIRCEPNPYWHQKIPILMGHFIQVDDEAYGIGVCEIAESLQQELNDKRNQTLDWTSFQIFPMLEVLRGAGINKAQLVKSKPNALVESNVLQGVRPINIGGNLQPQMIVDNVVKQDIRNGTGATNAVQGVDIAGTQTAYEVNTLERRGGSRINVTTSDFAEKILKPFYGFIYKYHQQYTSVQAVIKAVGEEGIKWTRVTPEDLVHEYDFYPIVSTDAESRVIIRNQLIQFIQAIAVNYPQTNVYKLVKKIYGLFGFDDADSVIPAPQTGRGINELSLKDKITVLSMGQKIVVHYWDNHLSEMTALEQFLILHSRELSAEAVLAFQDAINQHQIYLQNLEAAFNSAQVAEQNGNGHVPGRGQVKKPVFSASPISSVSQNQRASMIPALAGG